MTRIKKSDLKKVSVKDKNHITRMRVCHSVEELVKLIDKGIPAVLPVYVETVNGKPHGTYEDNVADPGNVGAHNGEFVVLYLDRYASKIASVERETYEKIRDHLMIGPLA